MEKDIVPELLELINGQFDEELLKSDIVKKSIQLLQNKKATYKNANEFAIELGEILSKALGDNITFEKLPNGKFHFNMANRILNDTMKRNYTLISNYSSEVQYSLNKQSNLRIKKQIPKLNQSRIDGIVKRVSKEDDFNKIKWILKEPIINFSQSVVDDTVKSNIEFHAKAGLKATITRIVVSDCCDWCRAVAGTYEYSSAPKDIYKRHRYCRCRVEYEPGDGRRQDFWTKKWIDPEKNDKIEARKKIGLPQDDIQLPRSVSAKAKDIFAKHDIPVRGETSIKSGSTIKQVNIIAGKGVGRQIDDINRLVRENPSSKPNDWQKVTGIAEMSNGKKAEVHWYQAKNIGKIEFKVKRWI